MSFCSSGSRLSHQSGKIAWNGCHSEALCCTESPAAHSARAEAQKSDVVYDKAVKRDSQRRYSLEEYFSVEETSHVKNEYCDGQIFAMAGASLQHNRITANLLSFARPALANR